MTVRNEQPSQIQNSIRQEVVSKNVLNVQINFNTENSEAVRELATNGKFGNSPEDVVIFALRFLYTVYRNRPDANVLVAEGKSGRTIVDL